MSDILFQYHQIHPTSWVYLSSLLLIGVFFKFSRFWSVRNLDLLLLTLLAPGFLAAHFEGVGHEVVGYIWLFSVGALLLIRLLIDPIMVRRPLLDPNLSTGGMLFLGSALFVFLMANILNHDHEDVALTRQTNTQAEESIEGSLADQSLAKHGPGYRLLFSLPRIPTNSVFTVPQEPPASQGVVLVARTTAFLSHLTIVLGMISIGFWHFGNIRLGIAAAMLYLLLPYTAQMSGRVDHVLPPALLVLAITCYRQPLIAGIFIGLAAGVVYYPLFLLPLWISFYWRRGLLRFTGGAVSMLAVMVLSLAFWAEDIPAFWDQVKQMFGLWLPVREGLEGIWKNTLDPYYRLPVLAVCLALSCSLAVWPPRKNLGTLLSCSAAVMLTTQFWHGYGGGTFIAWYLPLLLLTVFRPNLEDRVALSVLGEGWLRRRHTSARSVERAA